MNTQEHIKNCKECGNGFYCRGLDSCIKCQLKRGSGFTVSVDDETNASLMQMQRELEIKQINKDRQANYWAEQIAAQARQEGYDEALSKQFKRDCIAWGSWSVLLAVYLVWLFSKV